MTKITLVLFSFFASLAVSAQEVVSTQGDSYSNASANIDFTIGEVIIDTGTDGTNVGRALSVSSLPAELAQCKA